MVSTRSTRISGTSRPPTPSKEAPTTKQCRFIDTGFPNDELSDRYRVLRKLGHGSYSTVWLALDKKSSSIVAVKILGAGASNRHDQELSIVQHLAELARVDDLGSAAVTLLDHFSVSGPNGLHRCLVLEAMGPSAASMVDELPGNKPRIRGKRSRYSKVMAKSILKQVIISLTFLHKHNVTHGDVQPRNILFCVSGLDPNDPTALRQDLEITSEPLRRLDGKKDLWAPEYLTTGQSLLDFGDLDTTVKVKLSDFGAAFWTDKPPQDTVTPIRLRAPELIFSEQFDSRIDIWAFGCLVYEFVTGTSLFSVDLVGDDDSENANDDHILDLGDVLGPLPDRLISKWSRKHKYYGSNGKRIQPDEAEEDDTSSDADKFYVSDELPGDDLEVDVSGEEDAMVGESQPEAPMDSSMHEPVSQSCEAASPFINAPLEKLFKRNKPDSIDDTEAGQITAFIRHILQYEPSQRPTAEALRNHLWLNS